MNPALARWLSKTEGLTSTAATYPYEFLKRVDLFIKNQCSTLTCDDAYQMYYHMFYPLRVFRGNSTGFTGYAEFIVFRILWHVLGGDFEVDPPDADMERPVEFVSTHNRELRLAQGTAYRGSYPDLRIQNGQRVVAAAEIKIKGNMNDYTDAVGKLTAYHNDGTDVKGLLVAFWVPPNSKIRHYLADKETGLARESAWLTSVILEGDNRPIRDVLSDALGLDRVRVLIQSGPAAGPSGLSIERH